MCEGASAEITDKIFEYWSQNDNLEVEVNLSEGLPDDPAPFNAGTVARSRVYNRLHKASVPFSERSAGFVWFFSFLVQFATMKRKTKNVIILLDEPGLTLHGKAQADLLRYVENELLPHHQVVYSTHSPFMVQPNRLTDCRVVEDVIKRRDQTRQISIGTKIKEDVLTTDKDTLFPLQGALGYSVAQSLFVGENTLLVEGPSDILYLQALSNEIEKRGGTPLDPKWVLCPAGSIDNLYPFVSLFSGNMLNVAVLSDQGRGDKRKIERIRQSEILAAENVHTIADLLNKDEADIEDLFPPRLYCRLVNEAYGLGGDLLVTPQKLEVCGAQTVRQVKQMEAYFRTLPDEIEFYNHYRPAYWLHSNHQFLSSEDSSITELLDRANAIFEVYNKILARGTRTDS
ncbi:MAG: AAA family ATPase [Gammaproteobacteria bacterium]|nr:AAA family ATPase [Gammaproteobacteria bacterium]